MDKQQELAETLARFNLNSVNEKGDDGWTALMWASAYGEKDSAALLLDFGADTETRDNQGRTALMIASEDFPQKEIVELLLARGADINARKNNGRTALAGAQERESVYRGTEHGDKYAEVIRVLEAHLAPKPLKQLMPGPRPKPKKPPGSFDL